MAAVDEAATGVVDEAVDEVEVAATVEAADAATVVEAEAEADMEEAAIAGERDGLASNCFHLFSWAFYGASHLLSRSPSALHCARALGTRSSRHICCIAYCSLRMSASVCRVWCTRTLCSVAMGLRDDYLDALLRITSLFV